MSEPKTVDLSTFLADLEATNEPKPLDIKNPMTGESTGIVFWIAGPYSRVQEAAKDYVAKAAQRLTDGGKKISPEALQSLAIAQLARCVVRWEINDHGMAVPFSVDNVERVLRDSRAIRQQVDEFAGSFDPWRSEEPAQRYDLAPELRDAAP